MEYPIPIRKEDYHKAMLLILSQLGLNLTELEVNLLANLMKKGYTKLTKDNRRAIRDTLDIDQFTFNNYIKRLKDKGVIVKEKDFLQINQNLMDKVRDNKIHITFEVYDS